MNFDEIASGNEAVYSVSQFLDAVNFILKADKAHVRGEVTDFKQGKWISFSLKDKDDGSILKCVLGAWQYGNIGVPLQDGMEIKVQGVPSISKAYGSFGFWVEGIEPLGEGSLKKAYELLLKQLEKEGLFARKRPIPEFIKNIGVISSQHGVVIHDFRQNLDNRGYKLYFHDARVEGVQAVEHIVRAIQWFNAHMPDLDVLVIIRGGGSLESMQAFNNEAVARAIFASKIPIIAGIGHDVDVPIASLVADLEESTPTGAAQAINASWMRLQNMELIEQAIISEFEGMLALAKSRARIVFSDIFSAGKSVISKVNILEQKIVFFVSVLAGELRTAQHRMSRIAQTIEFANPQRNLRLGYSIVRNDRGKVITSVHDASPGDTLMLQVRDGSITTSVN